MKRKGLGGKKEQTRRERGREEGRRTGFVLLSLIIWGMRIRMNREESGERRGQNSLGLRSGGAYRTKKRSREITAYTEAGWDGKGGEKTKGTVNGREKRKGKMVGQRYCKAKIRITLLPLESIKRKKDKFARKKGGRKEDSAKT